jgi:glycosyltransferase involved in cell wall biosynthesis
VSAVHYRCYRNSYILSALYATALGIGRLGGILKKIDAYVCLTEFAKRKLLDVGIGEERIFVRPNFIDASQVVPSPGDGKYVLYLGRLSREKGLWTLVRAFERLRSVELKVAGTGPLESQLRAYVREKGLTNIEMLGFRVGSQKWELLSNSLLTIVPSECYEMFPMVTLEAYAAGKPVVGSNLGGLPYVIEDGKTGLLFEPGNVGDLISKIRYLLDRPAERQRMGECGRQLVETRYSPERSYRTLMSIFSQVCGTS